MQPKDAIHLQMAPEITEAIAVRHRNRDEQSGDHPCPVRQPENQDVR